MSDLSSIQVSAAEPVTAKDVYVHMVIDMQRGYVAALSAEDQNTLPQKIENFIARTTGVMRTLNICVEDEEMFYFGSEESKNWNCVLTNPNGSPLKIDHYKRGSSAFRYQSNYTECMKEPAHLSATGANHIVLSGINKSICVAETALDAINSGYRVTIISDLVADGVSKNQPAVAPAILKCIEAGVKFRTSQEFLKGLECPKPAGHDGLVPKI